VTGHSNERAARQKAGTWSRAASAALGVVAAIRVRIRGNASPDDEDAAIRAARRAAARDPKLSRYAGRIDPYDHLDRALGRK